MTPMPVVHNFINPISERDINGADTKLPASRLATLLYFSSLGLSLSV